MLIIKYINKLFGYLSNKNFGIFNIVFIKLYSYIFNIKINECKKKLFYFKNFNDFFFRKIKMDKRKINFNKNIIVSPCDGIITQLGNINKEDNILIKNNYYCIYEIFGKNKLLLNFFKKGKFLIIYLAPKNYHRIHMLYDGVLKNMFYIPGNLHSVNTNSYFGSYKKLFSNERVMCLFKTKFGLVLKILIGSIIVGGIETKWHGIVNDNILYNKIKIWNYKNNYFFFKKGKEIGRFRIGSSVMIIFQNINVNFCKNIKKNKEIFVGKKIAFI